MQNRKLNLVTLYFTGGYIYRLRTFETINQVLKTKCTGLNYTLPTGEVKQIQAVTVEDLQAYKAAQARMLQMPIKMAS